MATTDTDLARGGPGAPDAGAPAPPVWAQQRGRVTDRATARARRMVDSLPAWEPLPPGEIVVNRRREI
jgi:hypothetical protein